MDAYVRTYFGSSAHGYTDAPVPMGSPSFLRIRLSTCLEVQIEEKVPGWLTVRGVDHQMLVSFSQAANVIEIAHVDDLSDVPIIPKKKVRRRKS